MSKLFVYLHRQWAGFLALFLVLTGGVAYATHEVIRSSDIVDNQVFSADVRNDTLTNGGLAAADLRSSSVGTSEVLNDTATGGGLAAADLRSASVGTAEVANNAVTSGEIANGQVKRDDLGPAVITDGITRVIAASPNNDDDFKEVQATCPAGTEVTGGGYVGAGDITVERNYAVAANAWLVRASDPTFDPWQLTVTAVCAG